MSIPKTRAELRAALTPEGRPAIYTTAFWLDLGERVVTSAAGGAATVLALASFNLIDAASWQALAVGAATAALTSLLKGIAASRIGTGSASLSPGV